MTDTDYNIGDLVHVHDTTWRVRTVYTSNDGTLAVSLVDPDNPNHGTAYRVSLLNDIGVRIPTRTDATTDPRILEALTKAVNAYGMPADPASAHVARILGATGDHDPKRDHGSRILDVIWALRPDLAALRDPNVNR